MFTNKNKDRDNQKDRLDSVVEEFKIDMQTLTQKARALGLIHEDEALTVRISDDSEYAIKWEIEPISDHVIVEYINSIIANTAGLSTDILLKNDLRDLVKHISNRVVKHSEQMSWYHRFALGSMQKRLANHGIYFKASRQRIVEGEYYIDFFKGKK